jgi:aspartyl-tRNA(Asn)/glutamyl-tRNA(Gln) amidotransferase subunit A
MTAIADLDCAALTDAYRRGTLSPVEVVRDVLTRIERHAGFNAFVLVDAEPALAAARQSEARLRAGARAPATARPPISMPRRWRACANRAR